jgi:hypothetical protein
MWTKIQPETVLVNLGRKGSRTISPTVISGKVCLAPMTLQENDLWSEYVGGIGFSEVGAIANFGANTGLITPAVQAAIDSWLVAQGIHAAREHEALPLACTGVGFHHDVDYKDEIFCVVWLSDDMPWDVYFPYINKRIPLEYGTIFVFDSLQPHGVVPHGTSVFDANSFEYGTGVFASQDLVIDRKACALLGIKKYSRRGKRGMHIIDAENVQDNLSPDTAEWHIRRVD